MDFFDFLLWFSENIAYLIAGNLVLYAIVSPQFKKWVAFLLPLTVVLMVGGVVLGSHYGSDYGTHQYDPALPSIRAAVEDYVTDGKGDINQIIESGKYQPRMGLIEVTYLLKDLLRHTLWHSDTHNEDNIDDSYNKGNAWFEATIGEPMVYSTGIYRYGNESLMEAQKYKLDYVANALDLKKGDHVLDIGCGWGRLANHFSTKYGAKITGITLSKDQLAFGKNLNKDNGLVNLMLQNGMTMNKRTDLPVGGFDKITALEMAEHVGIRRYQEFLTSVRGMLKDDGVLYFQVAGLRRFWQYEDIVWGLFMGQHVFPGADASCPLGWVTSQLERAGFEIQRSHNLGTHYSRTIAQWLELWIQRKDSLVVKYGAPAWRRWEVFLRWSVRVARQGSSTVFLITATKAGNEAARVAAQRRIVPLWA